jgi:hypothetical protein
VGGGFKLRELEGIRERVFPSQSGFGVLVNNPSLICVLSALGTFDELHKTVIDPSKRSKDRQNFVAFSLCVSFRRLYYQDGLLNGS